MSGSADQIFGRVSAVTAVRALMERPEHEGVPRSLDRPVLIFEGAPGSGKTILLSLLTESLDQRVPHARVDMATSPRPTSTPDVLSALAFELGRECPLYGRLGFPRFVLGRLVQREQLDLDNRQRARQQVTVLLEKERNLDSLREMLVATSGGLIDLAPPPIRLSINLLAPVARFVSGLARDRLTDWASGRRIVLGAVHDWYGSRGLGLRNDAIDVLVDLNRWGRNPEDEDNRQRIEEMLWDAFLADLRAAFTTGRHAVDLTLNAVALLDNVDTEVGQRFLQGLVKARRRRAAEGRLAPDPLTVVATSRGAVLADLPAAGVVDLSPGAGGSAVPGRDENNGSRYWWARYRLADLTEDETSSMVSALALSDGNNERLTRMVHELTGGHPGSTRLLVDAVAERPEHREALAAVLDQPEPDAEPSRLRVGERMLRRFLMGVPGDVFDDLVTCAAARNRHDASRVAGLSELLDGGATSYEVIREVLWPVTGGAGPVLLRRLLLRVLSRRTSGDRPGWAQVFSWLRLRCELDGDEAGELYYALAVGDLTFVTGRMRERLTRDGLARWLEVLAEIISAPRRHPAESVEIPAPIEQVRALIREITPPGQQVDPLSRLIASLWIVGDPLTDSRRASLYRQLDVDRREIARSSLDDTDPLLRAADDHRKQAGLWK